MPRKKLLVYRLESGNYINSDGQVCDDEGNILNKESANFPFVYLISSTVSLMGIGFLIAVSLCHFGVI